MQNINIYAARASAAANDVIKNAVMTDGAVDAQMRWEDASYNVPNSAYYYTGTDKVNHGVALVGGTTISPPASSRRRPRQRRFPGAE